MELHARTSLGVELVLHELTQHADDVRAALAGTMLGLVPHDRLEDFTQRGARAVQSRFDGPLADPEAAAATLAPAAECDDTLPVVA